VYADQTRRLVINGADVLVKMFGSERATPFS
jgi:hypothetical protein